MGITSWTVTEIYSFSDRAIMLNLLSYSTRRTARKGGFSSEKSSCRPVMLLTSQIIHTSIGRAVPSLSVAPS